MKKYKTFWLRLLALFIDGLVFLPLSWVDEYVLSGAVGAYGIVGWGIFYSLISIAYYVLMHVKFGQTLGKMAVRVKVLNVTEEGYISLKQACIRYIPLFAALPMGVMMYVYLAFYPSEIEAFSSSNFVLYTAGAAIVWALLDIVTFIFQEERRALHDLIAGSVVVRVSARERAENDS
ncbi:MAG: RDD family protein [Pontibacterium sp.]